MMVESEVLMRHQMLLQGKSVLFFGNVRDLFWKNLAKEGNNISVFSSYFDFARLHPEVTFGLTCHQQAELGIYYWTKNKQECEFQLLQWLAEAKVGQTLLIVGENRAGVRSVEKLLAPFGEIAKIDSARRCGLYHFELTSPPLFDLQKYWKSYRFNDLQVFALPAVFSSAELDEGTKLLLKSFAQSKMLSGKVLDLGCGAGVIGASLKQQFPAIKLTQSDIHAMAISSSQRTLAENQLSGDVLASDVFSEIHDRFDLIVSNPPFHDGIDTAYQAVQDLIRQAKAHLNRGGELRIVANSFLPYADWLDEAFGSHQVLLKSNKFKVYSAKI